MGTIISRVTFRFGDFELDAAAYELRRSGLRLRLARQPMDLFLLLLERPGELVSRDDIARRLWGEGVFVDTDAGIHTAVLRIRQALGGSGGSSTFIETVPGKDIGSSQPSTSSRTQPPPHHPTSSAHRRVSRCSVVTICLSSSRVSSAGDKSSRTCAGCSPARACCR
jgi:DNA-binding winged helix-turn-helix (wHTH) protein